MTLLSKKIKCPICGYYTVKDVGDICPVCFAELGDISIKDDESIKAETGHYNKYGYCTNTDPEWVRLPRGIELPALYESNNIEAQNNPQYLFTKQCYENDSVLFDAAEHILFNDLTEEEKKCDNTYKDISKEETFKIFNALAYKNDYIGLRSAFNLALCYASGCGCNKDLIEAQVVLDEIMNYYDIKTDNSILKVRVD